MTRRRAATPGPVSWSIALDGSEYIGAVALIWNEDPPPNYLVEGSNDLLDWRRLAESKQGNHPAQTAIHLTEGEFSHLENSVDATRAGQVVGLREFAAYSELSDVPAALRLAAATSPVPDRTVAEVLVESSLAPLGVKLQEGLEISSVVQLPSSFDVKQLVPTASGAVFALIAAEDKSSSVVVRAAKNANGELETTNFLTGLDPETTIAWTEWVYTLEQSKLTAYRDTDRNGLADERYRIGAIYSRSDEKEAARIRFSEMTLEMDGRFYAILNATEQIAVFGKTECSSNFLSMGS